MRQWKYILILAIVLFNMSGCGRSSVEVVSEEQEKHYLRGKRLLREGRNQEALEAFLKVIDERKDAAESHLDAGRLYLTHVKDPISAIYHFRRYLELKPDSQQAKYVRQLIETAQKDFISRYPGPPIDEVDRLDLLELIEQLKAENLELKKQLFAAKRSGGAEPSETASGSSARSTDDEESDPNDVETRPASYTVKGGDSLTSISIQVYGTPSRWMDIYQANRDILPNPNSLKIGQELRLP